MPNFWLDTLQNSELKAFVNEEVDSDCLEYLKDIRAWEADAADIHVHLHHQGAASEPTSTAQETEDLEKSKKGANEQAARSGARAYFVEFLFKENPYFTNESIKKCVVVCPKSEYTENIEILKVQASKIHLTLWLGL